MQEIFNWMCEFMTFWYVDYGDKNDILYPITKADQKKVITILDKRANILIYDNNFYYLFKDVIISSKKTSYTFYLKKASYYRKQKALAILPYNLNESLIEKLEKLKVYYLNNNLPYILIIIENLVNNDYQKYLNDITYLNYEEKRLIVHADIKVVIDGKTYLFLSNNKTNNNNQKIIDILKSQKINFKLFKN